MKHVFQSLRCYDGLRYAVDVSFQGRACWESQTRELEEALSSMTFFPSSGSDERASLLQKVQTKDDFAAKKWRCMTHPSRALETLSPYAVLEVGIMTARDITERESGIFNTDTTPDSFVQVMMDDVELEKCKSPVARAKKEPVWMYHCEVDILAPMSMLRFQVKDDRPTEKAEIGFCDICVGDIPYNKAIEGWCELRFQESLLSTSVDRYNQHCQEREDTKSKNQFKKQEEEKKQEVEKKNESTAGSIATTQIPEDDRETKLVQKTKWCASSKDRTMDSFQACVYSAADKADEIGFGLLGQSLKEGGKKQRSNAGEIYVAKLNYAYSFSPPAKLFDPLLFWLSERSLVKLLGFSAVMFFFS